MDPVTQADAIQQDVSSEEQETATLTSAGSPRMRAIAAIEAKNLARIQEETGVDLTAEAAPAEEQIEANLAEPVEAAPAEAPAPADVRRVKVDGVEVDVPVEELVRTYQKNAAADRRLEEAARILREAEQLSRQREAEPEAVTTSKQTPEDLKAKAADVLSKLYDGDQEAATEALAELIAKAKGGDQPTQVQQQPILDDEQLTDRVMERMALKEAMATVQRDYPKIIADRDMEFLAATKVDRLVESGTPRSQAILTVSKELYESFGLGRPTQEPATNTRLENKARLDTIPRASAQAAAKPAPMENGNPSSVIAELAQRRLGQSLPR